MLLPAKQCRLIREHSLTHTAQRSHIQRTLHRLLAAATSFLHPLEQPI